MQLLKGMKNARRKKMTMKQIYREDELKELKPTGNVRYCIMSYTKDYEFMEYEKLMWGMYESEEERNKDYFELIEENRGNTFTKYAAENYLITEEN